MWIGENILVTWNWEWFVDLNWKFGHARMICLGFLTITIWSE